MKRIAVIYIRKLLEHVTEDTKAGHLVSATSGLDMANGALGLMQAMGMGEEAEQGLEWYTSARCTVAEARFNAEGGESDT
jgi:hypothetical protein